MSRVKVVLFCLFLVVAIAGIAFSQDEAKATDDLKSEEYLKQFLGVYDDEYGNRGEIKLNEETQLVALSPEGEEYVLEATAKDEFENEYSGLLLKFKRSEEDIVTSVDVYTPDGTITAYTKVEIEAK